MSMRQLLAALVIATALPLMALALVMFQQMVDNERRAIRDALMSNARALAAIVDNEIDTHLAVAGTLATSQALTTGDLATFRVQALRALEIVPGAWLSVSDPSGRFLVSTLFDFGQPLPPRGKLDIMTKVWATRQPQLSDIETGPISRGRNAFIEYPVFKDGAPLYSILVGLDPERFHKLIGGKFGDGATIGVLDREHKFVARIPDHDARLGTPASEGWQAAITLAPQGFAENRNLEGELSLTAYVPTRDGWTAGLSFPQRVLKAPLRRIFWSTGVVGSALLFAGIALALGLGRQLNRSMMELMTAAHKVGRGEIVPSKPQIVHEATAISEALKAASESLARQQAALRLSETRFRGTFENAAVGVAHVGLDGRWLEVNQRLCDIVGYSREELQARTYQSITHPDDLPANLGQMRKMRAGEIKIYNVDKRYLRRDGSTVWVGLTVTPQCDDLGQPLYFIAIVRDITVRKDAQDHQQFLMRELAHRSKNQLAIIQGMVGLTARNAASIDAFQKAFSQRIQGLAVSTDMLISQNWAATPLAELVRRQLKTFATDSARLTCEGPPAWIGAEAAEAIGLAVHELATNALKYGAWSQPAGTVSVRWTIERDGAEAPRLRLSWIERGGPPVAPPTRKGFGSIVIERMVAQKLDGTVELAFTPEGLSWILTLPASQFITDQAQRRQLASHPSITSPN